MYKARRWSQTNSYDRYGNRSVIGVGLSFNVNNNRITNSGYGYDAAGNLTNDGVHSYGFDGENKIKSVDGVSDVYRYDGDGNRIRKNFATGEKVRMVYSGGQLIAEYEITSGALKKEYVYGVKGLIATIEPANGTRYTTADHLGSLRVVTNASAGVLSRHDYMPFGEEIGSGIGSRTTSMGFSVADGVRQKFTSKERDNETGLDYFLARYYASTQGRFTSPDEFKGGPDELFVLGSGDGQKQALPYADIFNPQSLNKYQYCYNNPLRYVDPDGHDVWESIKGGAKEVANILMEGSPLIAFPNGVSKLLTGEPMIRPFDAANQAQSKGMTAVAVGAVFAPGPGGKTRAVGRVLSTVEIGIIKTAKTILRKVLDTKTLQAAAREASGEVVATKSSGVAYDHITEVKEGLQRLKNAAKKINKSLTDSTLSSEARASLQRTHAQVRTAIQRTERYIKEHNIQ